MQESIQAKQLAGNPCASMDPFTRACKEASRRVHLNPPAMVAIWEEGVVDDLLFAARAALAAGAPAAAVYQGIDQARPETEPFPVKIEKWLIESGLHPDTVLPGGICLLLQKLQLAYPPSVKETGGGAGQRDDRIYLEDLLNQGPNPEIGMPGSQQTALHIMVQNCLKKLYYPDSPDYLAFDVLDPADLYGDRDRAKYLLGAFTLMIQFGYDPHKPDACGQTTVKMLQHGYLQYSRAAQSTHNMGLRDMQLAIATCLEMIA